VEVLPILYLKGISTGEFSESLAALLALGKAVANGHHPSQRWLDRRHTARQGQDLA
jgi:hypothetical protein